jgi:predicted metal-dependent hydrolase
MSTDATGAAAAVDPRFGRFLELFNRGEFWDSHEALEAAWRETGSEFYHALILYASAFVHVRRGNRHGIAAQLGKAEPLLETRRPAYLGLDVNGILEHAAICRHLVAENREAPDHAWHVLIPLPRLAFRPDLVRGDEPELDGLEGLEGAGAVEAEP